MEKVYSSMTDTKSKTNLNSSNGNKWKHFKLLSALSESWKEIEQLNKQWYTDIENALRIEVDPIKLKDYELHLGQMPAKVLRAICIHKVNTNFDW